MDQKLGAKLTAILVSNDIRLAVNGVGNRAVRVAQGDANSQALGARRGGSVVTHLDGYGDDELVIWDLVK